MNHVTELNDSLLELERANLIEIWLDDDSVVVQLNEGIA